MNESSQSPFRLALTLMLGLLLAACAPDPVEAPLKGAAIGGPFSLTSQDGQMVSDMTFAGRYRIIYFGFSHCPDICPTDLLQISQALARFEKKDPERAAKVQPIFITVDPERDTAPVLKQYVGAFHPRLIGLTGTPAQIADVAKKFGIYYAREERPGSANYTMNHSRQTILFGPEGNPIVILPQEEGVDAVAAALDKWVR